MSSFMIIVMMTIMIVKTVMMTVMIVKTIVLIAIPKVANMQETLSSFI